MRVGVALVMCATMWVSSTVWAAQQVTETWNPPEVRQVGSAVHRGRAPAHWSCASEQTFAHDRVSAARKPGAPIQRVAHQAVPPHSHAPERPRVAPLASEHRVASASAGPHAPHDTAPGPRLASTMRRHEPRIAAQDAAPRRAPHDTAPGPRVASTTPRHEPRLVAQTAAPRHAPHDATPGPRVASKMPRHEPRIAAQNAAIRHVPHEHREAAHVVASTGRIAPSSPAGAATNDHRGPASKDASLKAPRALPPILGQTHARSPSA